MGNVRQGTKNRKRWGIQRYYERRIAGSLEIGLIPWSPSLRLQLILGIRITFRIPSPNNFIRIKCNDESENAICVHPIRIPHPDSHSHSHLIQPSSRDDIRVFRQGIEVGMPWHGSLWGPTRL